MPAKKTAKPRTPKPLDVYRRATDALAEKPRAPNRAKKQRHAALADPVADAVIGDLDAMMPGVGDAFDRSVKIADALAKLMPHAKPDVIAWHRRQAKGLRADARPNETAMLRTAAEHEAIAGLLDALRPRAR